MPKPWIQNWPSVAISEPRELVLKIMQAGIDAIDTELVLKKSIELNEQTLSVGEKKYNLKEFGSVYVLGFGKASAKAAEVIETIIGPIISAGVVISNVPATCAKIRSFVGTHPLPSLANVAAAKEMAKLIEEIKENDLVICLISGGGSALLCWDEEEFHQGKQLYENYLKTGQDIAGLNTVRKHISRAKGGGLAKMLYPATVVGLIFSDIAGGRDDLVDSGPTFFDGTTSQDAKRIVEKYGLGQYKLYETPKEEEYFHKVTNLTVVANTMGLWAMKKYAEDLGVQANILSAEMYFSPEETMEKILAAAKPGWVILGGGEVKLKIDKAGGRGGRSMNMCMHALNYISERDTFCSIDSDGLDNSDCAGAIVDTGTSTRLNHLNLDLKHYQQHFDGYTLFEQTGSELIYTGPTEANVSDFLALYRK